MNLTRKNELRQEARIKAELFRDELHLTANMPISIHRTVKEKNIQTFFRPMDDQSSGMAIKIPDVHGLGHTFMMINTSKALGHQRFTCCHELYHLLFQDKFDCIKEKTGVFEVKDENEFLADWFASYLILPQSGLETSIPVSERKKNSISLATLLKIEQKFRCSRRTLLYRLLVDDYIDTAYFEEFSHNVKTRALSYGYGTALYEPTDKTEYVGDYNLLSRRLLDDGKISITKYESLLEAIGIKIEEKVDGDGEI